MHYTHTQRGRKQCWGRLVFYSVLYYEFVMGIMKSLCSAAASAEVGFALPWSGWSLWVSLGEPPTKGEMVSPRKSTVEWIQNLKVLIIHSEYNPGAVVNQMISCLHPLKLLRASKWDQLQVLLTGNYYLLLGKVLLCIHPEKSFHFTGYEEKLHFQAGTAAAVTYRSCAQLCNKSRYSDIFKWYVSCQKIHISPVSSLEAHILWPCFFY